MHVLPRVEVFRERARRHAVIPVHAEFLADSLTPVLAFHRLAGPDGHAFLLESVEGGERVGRYSFAGRRPFLTAEVAGTSVTWSGPAAGMFQAKKGPPLELLKGVFETFHTHAPEGLPPFVCGAVGYFGYDAVRWVESLPQTSAPPAAEAEAALLFLSDVAAFDHATGRLHAVVNVWVEEGKDPDELYARAVNELSRLVEALFSSSAPPPMERGPSHPPEAIRENMDDALFGEKVEQAKEYIGAGDVFQVVLSRRFQIPCTADDLTLYRCLRSVNPSPYMFLLRLDGWSAIGASPEPLVRVRGDKLEYRPIAGTAPRTGDPAVDAQAREALKADEKERAEHVMLVDLGRNDLGRVAVTGTVNIDEFMVVEEYSHVMHLVSGLSGTLKPDLSPLDALFACLPAGTVSGAPKVRAMEIIEELEPQRRGLYAGAVGYMDFSGNLDTCIALRTMTLRDGMVTVQAGAGIVADSDPAREAAETRHKAKALFEAVGRALDAP